MFKKTQKKADNYKKLAKMIVETRRNKIDEVIAFGGEDGKGTDIISEYKVSVDSLSHRGINLFDVFNIQEVDVTIDKFDFANMKITCALENPIHIEGNGLLITDKQVKYNGEDITDYSSLTIKYYADKETEIIITK
ncbi:MAG: hypothetical protein KAX49_15785 [Halanaerobiales bacterium]|nr:hypothetical protein [Halanaerobiales bacterium]